MIQGHRFTRGSDSLAGPEKCCDAVGGSTRPCQTGAEVDDVDQRTPKELCQTNHGNEFTDRDAPGRCHPSAHVRDDGEESAGDRNIGGGVHRLVSLCAKGCFQRSPAGSPIPLRCSISGADSGKDSESGE